MKRRMYCADTDGNAYLDSDDEEDDDEDDANENDQFFYDDNASPRMMIFGSF